MTNELSSLEEIKFSVSEILQLTWSRDDGKIQIVQSRLGGASITKVCDTPPLIQNQIEELIAEAGACRTTFATEPGVAYCMVYSEPYAQLVLDDTSVYLTDPMCMQERIHLCSEDHESAMKNLVEWLTANHSTLNCR